MNAIPQSQFDAGKFAEFNLSRVFQCADIQQIEAELQAVRRGIEEETLFRNKQGKPDEAKSIVFGPVVVGEATSVTDHVDVFQYYRLVRAVEKG
jgi:hypothetical protein